MCGTVIGTTVGLLLNRYDCAEDYSVTRRFAMALLTGALKTESDPEVKAEI